MAGEGHFASQAWAKVSCLGGIRRPIVWQGIFGSWLSMNKGRLRLNPQSAVNTVILLAYGNYQTYILVVACDFNQCAGNEVVLPMSSPSRIRNGHTVGAVSVTLLYAAGASLLALALLLPSISNPVLIVAPSDLGVVKLPTTPRIDVTIYNRSLKPLSILVPADTCALPSNGMQEVGTLALRHFSFPVRLPDDAKGHHVATLYVQGFRGADKINFTKSIKYEIR
jgi:hypothetical protein